VGVVGRSVRATDSQVTGNGADPACGVSLPCADIAAFRAPRLTTTTCDRSLNMTACECTPNGPFGGVADPAVSNFGVCALD
jgi:hypothetical protein